MVLLIAVIAIAMASNPESQVLGLVGYAWAGFGCAFGPVVLLSLTWPKMTRNGALAGVLVGAATVIVWHNGVWFGGTEGKPLFGLYEMVPGFLFASIAIVVFSLLGKPASAEMRAKFGAMRAQS